MGVVSNLKNNSDSRIPSVDCKFVGTGRFPALETMLNRFPVAELLGDPPSPAAQRAHSHGNACGPASRRSQNLLKPRCAAVQAKKLRRQPSGSARWSGRTKITTSERCCTWFWPWWWPFARQSLARRDLPLWPTVRWHSLLHERVSHVSLRMRPLTEQWG